MTTTSERCSKCTSEGIEICGHQPRDTSHLGFTPAIANRSWKWRCKAEDAYKLPQTPILSIIVLTLKEGLNINDPLKTEHKFWAATIEYLKTLPDWRSMLWGTDVDDPSTILLLVQWGSSSGWQVFQNSFGVGHMLVMLAKPPSNRCAQLETLNLGARGRVLELTSFAFNGNIDREIASGFYERWKVLAAMAKKDYDVDCYGQWMERDVPHQPYLPDRIKNLEAYKEADQEPSYFAAILSWCEGSYSADFTEFEAFTASLILQATRGFNRIVVRSVSDIKAWYPPPQIQETAPHSTACLFKISPKRRYLEDNGIDMYKHDKHAHASVREVSNGRRLYPAPYGEYVRMGEINQYGRIGNRLFSSAPWLSPKSDVLIPIDICWLEFKPRVLESASLDAKGVLWTLRATIQALEGCSEVNLGRDEERSGVSAILVTWASFSQRALSWDQFQSCFQAFHTSETIDSRCLEIQSLASKTSLGYLGITSHLEVVSFYLPPNDRDKSLFEASYHYYKSTMSLKHILWHGGSACQQRSSGWQSDTVTRNGAETYCFTSFIEWKDIQRGTSLDMRKEWYGDFAKGMDSYDRLGHQVDALQMLATAGVESRFIALDI